MKVVQIIMSKKHRFLFRGFVALLMVIMLLPSVTYAASDDFSTVLSPNVIRQYSTYRGVNATQIPIITYHKIVSDKDKRSKAYRNDKWTISQSNLEKQIAWLNKKHYRTINCDEFYLWHQGKIKLPERSVLITIDDGKVGSVNRLFQELRKYNMKGTAFIIGKPALAKNSGNFMSTKRMRRVREVYPKFEFQSHTYGLHYRSAYQESYKTIKKDADIMKKWYGFNYIAYPYGYYSSTMIRAYKDNGIRMGFSFGDYGYATRKQSRYAIRRFGVLGNTTLRTFKSWCP